MSEQRVLEQSEALFLFIETKERHERMEKKLLIIGAGGRGGVVAEVAEKLDYQTSFLDDSSEEAVGKLSDIEKFAGEYPYAFVGIGNNVFREEILQKLENAGYQVPILIHPTAYVSKTALIGRGTVIEPMAIVNANSRIEEGVIVSVGAIIDHDTWIEKYAHINAGAIVKAGGAIKPYEKLEAGEVRLGYENARVKR